ncbi:MAG: hypothetical protein PVF83_12945 [Anaerolineales bacterium]|jgi:hypothetical protein
MFGEPKNNLRKQVINAIKEKLAEQREELIKIIETHKLKLLQLELTNPGRSKLSKAFTQREYIKIILVDAEYQWIRVEETFELSNQGIYGECSLCNTNINIKN